LIYFTLPYGKITINARNVSADDNPGLPKTGGVGKSFLKLKGDPG
jgi:hypothetical protein